MAFITTNINQVISNSTAIKAPTGSQQFNNI